MMIPERTPGECEENGLTYRYKFRIFLYNCVCTILFWIVNIISKKTTLVEGGVVSHRSLWYFRSREKSSNVSLGLEGTQIPKISSMYLRQKIGYLCICQTDIFL